MVGLLELPLELFLEITGYIDSGQDWKSLAAVDRCFNFLAIKRFWNNLDRDKQYRILMWACAAGSLRALRRLLESGLTTNVNLQVLGVHGSRDQTPAFYLGQLSQHDLGQANKHHAFLPYMDDIHQLIPDYQYHRSCWKPIHVAVRHGQSRIVETLLHHGAWIDEPSQNYCLCKRPSMGVAYYVPKYTALHLALCTGQEEIAQLLISEGASLYVDRNVRRDEDSYSPDRGRITALHFCAIHGSLSTTKAIIEEEGHETVIDERDEFGWSAIMYAYRHFKNDVFGYLLAKGAATQVSKMEYHWNQDSFDPTASELLHQACLEGRWEIVVKLVQHGSDPSTPDKKGRAPISLCLSSFNYRTRYGGKLDKTAEVPMMVEAIKICGMHLKSRRETLIQVMETALWWPIPALVSLILDAGIDSSTMIQCLRSCRDRPAYSMARLGDEEYDHYCYQACYLDTGRYARQQNLLDFACTSSSPSPELHELITLLLARGCMESEDTDSYFTTLKNLCCGAGHRIHDEPEKQEYTEREERKCAQLLCARLATALRSRRGALRLPLDLLYICFDRGQYSILGELAQVVNFSDTECSEQELRHFFNMLTETWWLETDQPLISSRLRCVKFLFQLGGSDAILHSRKTFKRLCRDTLGIDGGQEAIMTYLDCGGWYHFSSVDARTPSKTPLFHAIHHGRPQFARRLLDLGADPNKLLALDPSEPHWSSNDAWHHNSGDDVGVLRVLLERGGNPFRADNRGIGFPFGEPLKTGDKLEFFRELCRLTINDDTDDADLFDILDFACEYGRYEHIQTMRKFAGHHVDAVIRENGVFLLKKLLVNLSPSGGASFRYTDTFQQVDHAISTAGLVLQIGGPDILTFKWKSIKKRELTYQRPSEKYGWSEWGLETKPIPSWRLSKDIDDYSSLEFLEKLLTHPEHSNLPPEQGHSDYDKHRCEDDYIHSYRIRWCLEQRIKIGSEFDTNSVTILDGRIKRPSWASWVEDGSFTEEKPLSEDTERDLEKIFVCDCEWRDRWLPAY